LEPQKRKRAAPACARETLERFSLCIDRHSAGGGAPAWSLTDEHSYRSVARVSKPRIARKQSSNSVAAVVKREIKQVAETQVEKKDETVAVNTTPVTEKAKVADAKPADATPADAKATEKVASAAKDVGCKQFFPSAGLTLSVPCN
jgi:hypothetical protein